MKIKIEGTILRFKRNKNNSGNFWNPIGLFQNTFEIQKDGKWYNCYFDFIERNNQKFLVVKDLILLYENTNSIKEHLKPNIELRISKTKKIFFELLRNSHDLNYRWFYFRKNIYRRRNSIFAFLIVIIITLVYYKGSQQYSSWGKWVNENSWIQILAILLNIISFGSLFFQFSITEQTTEDDIKRIVQIEIEKREKVMQANEIARKRATF